MQTAPTITAAIPDGYYVYHLTNLGVVVYVGYTNNLLARIGAHKKRLCGKFDGYVAFQHGDRLSAQQAELRDIDAMRPTLNIKMKAVRPCVAKIRRRALCSDVIRLRVEMELKARLFDAAQRNGMKLSDFVRAGLKRLSEAEGDAK